MIVDNAHAPTTRVAEWPVALNSFADRTRLGPAPDVGEHSRKILAEFGLAADEIETLISAGAVRDSS
jgi:crotonobetainyl-CoA:carnitine CoA-transferase CaiB-like acyl-CoA transferase